MRTNNLFVTRAGWFVSIFLLTVSSVPAAEKFTERVVCRDDLSSTRRTELAEKLRNITGWSDLKFGADGFLRVGRSEPTVGSRSARDLLKEVVYGKNVVVLEDASRRSDVVFCRVVPGSWKNHSTGGPPVYVVLIDFADFEQITGDQLARAAFHVGWGLLHELDHIVNDSSDAASLGQPGECEDHINQMRRECNLPQRVDYYFALFPIAIDDAFATRFVRLRFDQEDPATKKKRRYWLIWDARLVGGLDAQRQVATLR